MEVFRAVMQEGSITAAAQALGVSQPSVSEILRHAEEKLGLRLFDRIKGRLRSTIEARRLFIEVERVFECVDRVHHTAEALRDAEMGALRIATISALGLTLAPALLGAFTAAAPQVECRLMVLRRLELTEALLNEQFDIGLTFLMGHDMRLQRRELQRRGLLCLVPRLHPLACRPQIALHELAVLPLIAFTPLQTFSTLLRRLFGEAGLVYRPAIEVEQIIQAWSLVQAGAGCALVDPFSGLAPLFPDVAAVPLAANTTLSLEAIMPRGRPVSIATQAFLKQAGLHLSQR
jgi:DNA-binding transcriptional LysR family regulator